MMEDMMAAGLGGKDWGGEAGTVLEGGQRSPEIGMPLPGRNCLEKNGLKTGPSVAGLGQVLRDGHGLRLRFAVHAPLCCVCEQAMATIPANRKAYVPREKIDETERPSLRRRQPVA